LKPLEKSYLELQFNVKIFKKSGTEFQTFFESLMLKKYPNFKKIRPYPGDKGNDGYFHKEGIYYQVYSPIDPYEKLSTAANKLKNDFGTLKKNWDKNIEIQEYNFVYNDKYLGAIPQLIEAISDLEKKYDSIRFNIITSNDLEKIFFQLDTEQLSSLGFKVDSTEAFKIVLEMLNNVEIELDRENLPFVQRYLASFKPIVHFMAKDELEYKIRLYEARLEHRLGNSAQSIKLFTDLINTYPQNIEAYLYLSGVYLELGDLNKNESCLLQADKLVNSDSQWFLNLQKLYRKLACEKNATLSSIEEELTDNPIINSKFYYLHSFFYYRNQDYISALSMINKAINANPNKVGYYLLKLNILWDKQVVNSETKTSIIFGENISDFITKIQEIDQILLNFDSKSPKTKAMISYHKMMSYFHLKNLTESQACLINMFKHIIDCHFDHELDNILYYTFISITVPLREFNATLDYLNSQAIKISDRLAKALLIHFSGHNQLLTDTCKHFFENKKSEFAILLLNQLKNKKFLNVCESLKADPDFACILVNTPGIDYELKEQLINNVPDSHPTKNIAWFHYHFEKENFDLAFNIIKKLDFSILNIQEYNQMYLVAKSQDAWDYVITILKILLDYTSLEQDIINIKFGLLEAYFKSGNYLEVIKTGEEILFKSEDNNLLSLENRESVITNVISGFIKRNEYSEALIFLENYTPLDSTYNFKLNPVLYVYAANNLTEKALEALINGVIQKSNLSEADYASLYEKYIEINLPIKLEDLPIVSNNCFVKLINSDKWFYIGEAKEFALDAVFIDNNNPQYILFINKSLNDTVNLNPYLNEPQKTIEKILNIKDYILYQIRHCFNKLVPLGGIPNIIPIEIIDENGSFNFKNLFACIEDLQKPNKLFFENYCSSFYPLTTLAINNGGLLNAIGRIVNNQKGFIHCNLGHLEELQEQKNIAEQIINGDPFYLDALSALILAESGIFPIIFPLLPGLNISQSVINFINSVILQFKSIPGQVARGAYTQGKLLVSKVRKEEESQYLARYGQFINLLENTDRVKNVSGSRYKELKIDKVIPEITDSRILAQDQASIVLTDDVLYLTALVPFRDEIKPRYCSSMILVRTLYDLNRISFESYINFFSYLASYRFRFLELRLPDLEKAVFGDDLVKTIKPQNIRKFNFKLTLSEEYGVPFNRAFYIVTSFLLRQILDEALQEDKLCEIFLEILSEFPTKLSKQSLGRTMLEACRKNLYNNSNIIVININKLENKLTRLYLVTEIYETQNGILLPKTNLS
jgi:hypothetical protein